jgi:hypothetical protein
MGHGYIAVVAHGIVININSVQDHLQMNKKTVSTFLDKLKYFPESDLREYFNTHIINIDDFLQHLRYSKFDFHYEQQYDIINIFITLSEKQICGVNFRGDGCVENINSDELKLAHDEILSLEKLEEFLTGNTTQIKFTMYTYEGC